MKPHLLAVSILVLVAGCNRGAPEANATATATAPSTDGYEARIEKMAAPERNAVLYRAIHDAGRDCQHVAASESAGTINGAPAWSAQCDDGGKWLVLITKGGSAEVLSAAEAAQAGVAAAQNGSAGQ